MNDGNILISVVIPCYNEAETLEPLWAELEKIRNLMFEKYQVVFEFLFVDDGSSDATLESLKKLAVEQEDVGYLAFSRNFGKEAAMYAGLQASKGDYVVIMDADLQDPPSLLPEMYEIVSSGEYDCAATRRVTRKGEPILRSWFAKMFYRIINKISKTPVVDGARDFRFMTRRFVDAVLLVKENNRFSKGIFGWVGFDVKWLEYENVPRVAGKTKWNFWGLLKYAIDGMVGFSATPLAISSFFGFFFCLLSFFFIGFIVVRKLLFGDPVDGWASMVSIILFVSGVQLFCVSVLGQYLSKTYAETKHRPIFILKDSKESKGRKL